jgi:hypothetical protein
MPSYRFTLKSEEQEGASQSNNVYIDLANDADAILMAGNLETAFAADVVTVDTVVNRNYTLPYPAGTNASWRYVIRAGPFVSVQTERVFNVKGTASAESFASSYKALANVGWCPPPYTAPPYTIVPIVSISVAGFDPPASQ